MDQPTPAATTLTDPAQTAKPTNFRWVICGLLFYATTLNYTDRSVLGVLATDLPKIGLTKQQYGNVGAAFAAAYAIGFIFMGPLVDAIGTRLGYAFALLWWTIAGASTALARSPLGFGFARFMLGLGEAGNFPSAIKTTAEWFPRRQRATATGVFNAGANVGNILAPLLVPVVVAYFNWHAAFLITPILASFWIVAWLAIYRKPEVHPRVNQAERDLILSDKDPVTTKRVKWAQLVLFPQAWAIMVGKFLTDAVWWFYGSWTSVFMNGKFNVDIKHIGLPLIVIYVLADFGSVIGGWLSSTLIHRGWTPNAARKTAMFACALAVMPVSTVTFLPNSQMWTAVVLIGVAAAAHQGFSANIFTLTSDMFPKYAIGSIVSLAGCCGAIGGIVMQVATGYIAQSTGSFRIMFIIAAIVYVLAVTLVHLIAPRLRHIDLAPETGIPAV